MSHPVLFTHRATVGSCAALVAVGLMLAAYGPAIVEFKNRFGIGDAAAGLGMAAQSVGAVVGVLAAQPVLRRKGNRFTMTSALLLMAAGCGLIAVAPTWSLTVVGAALSGFGLGGCDALTTQLFVFGQGDRGPMLVNVVHGCFGLGTVIAPVVLAFIGVENYRLVFGAAAFITVGAAATMAGLSPRPTPADTAIALPASTGGRGAPRTAAAVIAGFLLLYVLHFGVQQGLGSWGPSRLLELGYTSASASLVIAGYWMAMVVGRFAAAPLAGRVPLSVLVTISCIGSTAAIALALYSPATIWAYVLAGLFIGPIFPNGLTWLAHTPYAPGAVFAYVIAAAMAGAAVFPPILGVAIGAAGVDALAPALLAGMVLAVASCGGIGVALRRAARATSLADAAPATCS